MCKQQQVAVEEPEVDAAEAKKQRKAAKRAAAEAAAVAAEEPEVDAAEAKRARKAAKKAAAEAAPVEDPEADAAEAKKARKAAKKAAAEAVAAEEAAAEEEDPVAAKKARKAAKRAAAEALAATEETVEEVKTPELKKSKEDVNAEDAPKAAKGKGKGNKEFEIFVGGLPFATTEDALKKDFAECGEIVAFRMPLNDEGNARGIAFIEYADKESCDKALKFHDTEYAGRWISVRMSGDAGGKDGKSKGKDGKGKDKGKGKGKDSKDGGKGNKEFELFIGGLPWSTTEDVLRKDFTECGEIVSLRMPLNDEGSARGIAFIEYADKESVDKALKFNATDYGGRTLSVRMSGDPAPPKGDGKGKGKDGKGKGNKEFEVFVGGLPFSSTEEALKQKLADCGEIVNLRMPLNDEGKPRGIAFIEFKDKDACEKALKLHESEMDGRWLSVKMSGDGGGKDGKGKGKDGKGKGKGKKGKATSEAKAKNTGCIVEGAGEKKTFDDSDDE